ncbi:MAG: AAA family ATPase [Candidatus Altarchaeaceae archaeon]
MLTEKYSPKKISEFYDKSIAKEIEEWAKKFDEILLLTGERGVGKTALINAIANEKNFEILYIDEENLSRFREFCLSGGLFKKVLIVVDNFNELRGKELLETIEFLHNQKINHNPIILTAYDIQDYETKKKIQEISKFCKHIKIEKQNYLQISKILENICKEEKISVSKEILNKISKNANGDLRAAIIDLENYAIVDKKISESDIENYTRDTTSTIFNGLKEIFKSKNLNDAINAYNRIDEDPKMILLWIDENVPREYEKINEIEKAYYYLSRADIFNGRIISRQYWGYLRYVSLFISSVSLAKDKEYHKFTSYSFPKFLVELSRMRSKKEILKSIAKKFSILHVSQKVAMKEYIPLFSILIKKGKINEEKIKEIYKLTDKEIEYLKEYK